MNTSKPHSTLKACARAFLIGIAIVCLMVIYAAFATPAHAGTGTAEKIEGVFWPIVGVVCACVAIVCFHLDAFPSCGGYAKESRRAGVEPTKPWDGEPLTPWPKIDAQDDLCPSGWPAIRPIVAAAPYQTPPEPSNRSIDNYPLPDTASGSGNPDKEAYKDEVGVTLFTLAMRLKLAFCRDHKGRHGWHDPDVITNEQLELALLIVMRKGDVVDIANHCMMLHERGIKNIKTGVRK